MEKPRIFVQIAAYRDPETVFTVKDLFEKATHPERIFVGICNQYDPVEDAHCFAIPWTREAQVRQKHFHYKEAQGIGWARATAQSLWDGEEYTLGIDGHMRFVQGWDEKIIAQLSRCPNKKSILTTLLPTYTPPDQLQDLGKGTLTYMHVSTLSLKPGFPLVQIHGGIGDKNWTKDAAPFPAPLWVGNFLFCRSEVQKLLPHDPYLYFHGEEICYSVRLFTHGYNIYQPGELILYHQWQGRDALTPRPYRNSDNPRANFTFERVMHFLQITQAQNKEVLIDIDAYALGKERTLDVFWKYAGINLQTMQIAEHAAVGKWPSYRDFIKNPINQDGANAPMQHAKLPRIFVQIASYRDPECQWTVKDLFEKAAHPERIFVGICWQFDPEEDEHCFEVEAPRPDQVRIDPWHWEESLGVCWARNRTQQLFEGEEYTLMIDSHMRFAAGWDDKMIAELAECDSPKPILTCHPASYTPPNNLEENPKCTILRAHLYSDDGDIRFKGEFLDRAPEKPLNGAFIAAGFMFSKSDIIREVPYDPYLYFNQEEVSLAARFYTWGWDVYSSKQQLLYHYYNTVKSEVKKRPLHWQDNSKWTQMQAKSRQRLDHLFGIAPAEDPDAVIELPLYALGPKRTLKQFIEYSGLDVQKKIPTQRALRAEFIRGLNTVKDFKVYIPELDAGTDPIPFEKTEEKAVKNLMPSLNRSIIEKPIKSIPDPSLRGNLPFDQQLLSNSRIRSLTLRKELPEGVLIFEDYLEPDLCRKLADYADSQTFTKLNVVDHEKSDKKRVVTAPSDGRVTDHVEIDGMAGEILSIMNDVYCNRLSPFYNVNFEWYERPQILRYPPGGKYNQHADADHWLPDKKKWVRTQDRDYSVLLYLNEEYEGGELEFNNYKYKFKPKTGMLVGFPSGHQYLHAAHPTTSGIRYVIVSWAAILGTPRVRPQAPYASVFVRQKRF